MPNSTGISTLISIVRHGHVYNPDQVIYGRLPGFELSALGRKQAQVAAGYLSRFKIAALFSSPLLRAVQTAEILAAPHPDLSIQVDEAVNEVRFHFEGAPMSDMEARNWDLYTGVSVEYEQPPAIVARVIPFLRHITEAYTGKHVIVVTHGDVIAFTILALRNIALHPANKHTLDQLGLADDYPALGSVTTFTFTDSKIQFVPAAMSYTRPYGSELIDQGTSPK